MINISQDEVMQLWRKKDNCIVSVVCATYNHEKYIEQAIKSFLSQKTNFPFEIIIHDDASLDRTPDIIRRYHAAYPSIIRPIFQTENQYSKGNFKPSVHAATYAVGKYIALCEGDDYWIDSQKLTKQLAAFERYPKCDICFHPALCFSDNKKKSEYVINNYSDTERIFPLEDFITGGGGFCPTASLMIRRNILKELPDWFYDVPVGDYYLQFFGAKRGGGVYLPDVMSIYRYAVDNSATALIGKYTKNDIDSFISADISSLNNMISCLGSEYATSINIRKANIFLGFSFILLGRGDFRGFRNFITSSWHSQKRVSLLQIICYTMRGVPQPLMLILKIKRRFFLSPHFFGIAWGVKSGNRLSTHER